MGRTISTVIVNFNGKHLLGPCFDSLSRTALGDNKLELIMVDNTSKDRSVEFINEKYPHVRVLTNNINNYSRALNIGIEHSSGEYVAILNNDTEPEPQWLMGLLKIFDQSEKIGAVQSKIMFLGKNVINSTGTFEGKDFHFVDIGFGEEDNGQYDSIEEREYLTGCAVLYRRECLEEVGKFDEDYNMYYEDIDYSVRCRKKGWKLLYSPESKVYHRYHGSATDDLCTHFCSRNRLMFIGKHLPSQLVQSIRTSHPYLMNQYDDLYWYLIKAVKKMILSNDENTIKDVLKDLKLQLVVIFGTARTYTFFSHLEVALGLRKVRMGIYDHAFHFAGGGQRYIAIAAEALQDRYDITYISNKDCSLEKYWEWYGIDLSKCGLKIIKLPFYEEHGYKFINETHTNDSDINYFEPIIKDSMNYDIFLNVNMLTRINPQSPLSIFMCHFPDREIERYFSAHLYDYLITNGRYSSFWVKKKWGLTPSIVLYPPVDMYNPESSPHVKENIILSVARFEVGGSKKQLEMIQAFHDLSKENKQVEDEWQLILVGGNPERNPYFLKIDREIKRLNAGNILLRPNLMNDEVKDLYKRASIFWHACGLGEIQPHLIEHFGMTTVEAMQNYCVPIVIDGGGQREIVEHGKSGFRFGSLHELKKYTSRLIQDEPLRRDLARGAYERSHTFNSEVFKENFLAFISNIENRLRGGDPVDL